MDLDWVVDINDNQLLFPFMYHFNFVKKRANLDIKNK